MPTAPRTATPARAGLRRDTLGESWAERRGAGTVTVRQVAVAQEVAALAERELRAASKLSHAGVLRPLEIGQRPGALQVVNARAPGPTLRQMLEAHASGKSHFEPSQATWIALRILDALACAHEHKDEAGAPAPIAHGRVSPEHVIVTRQGEVLLTGFGLDTLARSVADDAAKPDPAFSYLAPEQCGGAPAQPASDVFAVGSVLAELLVGEPVFLRPTLAATREAVANHLPDAFRAKRAEIPKALDEAILFALEKAVERRARAGELAKKLGAFMGMMEVADRIKADQHQARLADFIRIRMRDLVDPLDPNPATASAGAKPKRGRGKWVRRIFRIAAVSSLAALGVAVWARWPDLEPELLRVEFVRQALDAAGFAPEPPTPGAVAGQTPGSSPGADPATAALAPPGLPTAVAGGPTAAVPVPPGQPNATAAGPAAAVPTPPGQASAPAAGPAAAAPAPSGQPNAPVAGARAGAPIPPGQPTPARAHLDIESTPPSTVFLDGTRIGTTPMKGVEVSPGAHRVEFLVARAKRRHVQKVKVAAGETRRLRVKVPRR